MDTFANVIEAIFAKLLVRYGAAWLRQWDGVDMGLVKADWADELAGFQGNLEPLRYALRHLPDRCPTVGEFRALANRCPPPELPRLEAPKADQARAAAELEKLGPMRSRPVGHDAKDWALRLLVRHKAGEKLRPFQLRCAREAMGLEGRMAWKGKAA